MKTTEMRMALDFCNELINTPINLHEEIKATLLCINLSRPSVIRYLNKCFDYVEKCRPLLICVKEV